MLFTSEWESGLGARDGEGSSKAERSLVMFIFSMSKYTLKWSHVSPSSQNTHFPSHLI